MGSPFEQFELILICPIILYGVDISITNFVVYLFMGFVILVWFFWMITRKLTLVPVLWQILVEQLYNFVLQMLTEQAGRKAQRYFSSVFAIFIFILILNLLGLTPFSFAVTGQLVVTFLLSFSFFMAWVIIGINNLGFKFFKIFVPRGIPTWLMPLLVVIEILSFCVRPISLGIRLFANLLAGHILLFIIASATLAFCHIFVLLGAIPLFFLFLFVILEIGIAFLQAYVFTILLCIYLNDAFNIH